MPPSAESLIDARAVCAAIDIAMARIRQSYRGSFRLVPGIHPRASIDPDDEY
jgi:hypothetical protein